jgi:ABC-type transporter Mla subunit MlaD
MKEKRTELLVGVFLFIGLVILGGLVLRFGNFDERFKDTYSLTVTFADGGGLVKGTDVRLGGVKIGRVAEQPRVNLDNYGGAIVLLEVFRDFQIPTGSEFSIGSSGLLGDSLVQIEASKERDGSFIAPGTIIDGKRGAGLGALASSAEDLSQKGQIVLEDVRDALGDLGSAFEKLDQNILRAENLKRFDTAMAELTTALESLNSGVLTEGNTDNIRDILANLKQASVKMDDAAAKLGPLLDKGDEAMTSLKPAMASLEPGMQKLYAAAEGAGDAIDKINNGEGLLRALLEDDQLRDEVQLFVTNLRRSGILRYKDTGAEDLDNNNDRDSPSGRRKGLFNR